MAVDSFGVAARQRDEQIRPADDLVGREVLLATHADSPRLAQLRERRILVRFLDEFAPDVLCLQETRLPAAVLTRFSQG